MKLDLVHVLDEWIAIEKPSGNRTAERCNQSPRPAEKLIFLFIRDSSCLHFAIFFYPSVGPYTRRVSLLGLDHPTAEDLSREAALLSLSLFKA